MQTPSPRLLLSTQPKWQERFIIKRIGEDDIEITLEQRNEILKALNNGGRFIQVRKHTLMLNSIKSIDPKWGEDNIPPRPEEILKCDYNNITDNTVKAKLLNKEEIEEWDSIFGNQKEDL
jgi:hypothetical protein